MTNKITIHLAAPRGFCAGVDRAIEIVKKTIKKYGTPVYVRHEIVHNKYVVEDLKKQGVIFIEELDEVKDKSRPVIFSAHGVPKSVPDSAKIKKILFILAYVGTDLGTPCAEKITGLVLSFISFNSSIKIAPCFFRSLTTYLL